MSSFLTGFDRLLLYFNTPLSRQRHLFAQIFVKKESQNIIAEVISSHFSPKGIGDVPELYQMIYYILLRLYCNSQISQNLYQNFQEESLVRLADLQQDFLHSYPQFIPHQLIVLQHITLLTGAGRKQDVISCHSCRLPGEQMVRLQIIIMYIQLIFAYGFDGLMHGLMDQKINCLIQTKSQYSR